MSGGVFRPKTAWTWVRLIGNTINLSTPIGLLIATAGRSTVRRGPRGLFLADGYRLKFPIASAFTVGNVIICTGSWADRQTYDPTLLQHEEMHTWQYLYCLGLPFYVAYSACMGWSMLRTGDRAAQNFFERQAGLALGGYREAPIRPMRQNIRGFFTGTKGSNDPQ